MKILLIKPNTSTDTIIPPIGLGYLASMVRDSHQVKIVDCLKEKVDIKRLANIIKEYCPDLVGIQVFNNDKIIAYKYLKLIKEINKKIVTVIGGPFPSCQPGDVFDFFKSYLDFAFCGEAEVGFKKLVERLQYLNPILDDIEGLIYKKYGAIKINKNIFVDNLDKIPYPSWDLLKLDEYPPSPLGGFLKKYPVAPIIVSRGCPYKCGFCAGFRITGKKVRYRSIENVIGEIELLYYKFSIREIHIIDDNFTFESDYVYNFCKKLLEKKIMLKFSCPNGVRIDTLNMELLLLMKSAGFYRIYIGIESGSKRILDYMDKHLTVEFIVEKAKLIKRSGLNICGYFIIGYPTETVLDLIQTIKLSLKLPLDRVHFMNFLPIPGSPIYNSLNHSNIKRNSIRNFYTVNYFNPNLPPIILQLLKLFALFIFYLRPKIIVKNLSEIYNLKHLYFLLKRVFNIVRNV